MLVEHATLAQDPATDLPDRAAAVANDTVPLRNGDSLQPALAWSLVERGQVTLVDVRTAEERKFVGHVPHSLHVPWATGTAMTRNPRFVRELEAKIGKDRPVLLLCRSGKRSALAVEAAIKAGFTRIANIAEGFEGDIDTHGHRGGSNGWRFHGLPWVQD